MLRFIPYVMEHLIFIVLTPVKCHAFLDIADLGEIVFLYDKSIYMFT